MYKCHMCGRDISSSEAYQVGHNSELSKALSDGKYKVPSEWMICMRCKTLLSIQSLVAEIMEPF